MRNRKLVHGRADGRVNEVGARFARADFPLLVYFRQSRSRKIALEFARVSGTQFGAPTPRCVGRSPRAHRARPCLRTRRAERRLPLRGPWRQRLGARQPPRFARRGQTAAHPSRRYRPARTRTAAPPIAPWRRLEVRLLRGSATSRLACRHWLWRDRPRAMPGCRRAIGSAPPNLPTISHRSASCSSGADPRIRPCRRTKRSANLHIARIS